jgi:ring-1,2-phenylacetyl-CoA epoxidase subunit PaaE
MIQSLFKWKDKKDNKKKTGSVSYYDLTVREIIRETEDAITIVFDNSGEKIEYKAGQYVTLIMQIDGEEVRRSYSLSSSPITDDHLAVTVKKVEGGNVSRYLNHQLKAGDSIRLMQPMGKFTTEFDSNKRRTLLLFAGGSGITPLISILKSLLAGEPSSNVLLIYQNRNLQSIIFRDLIDTLSAKYPDRFKVIHVLSKPEKSWKGRSGRITADMVKNIISETEFNLHNTEVFFCGPAGMMETAGLVMEELGVDRSRFHKESFVATPAKKEEAEKEEEIPDDTSRVHVVVDGQENVVMVKRNEFILETALDNDVDIPFSCQSGLCTTCRGKLISGKVRMEDPDGLSDDEIAQGYVLTCVSHPDSNEIKIEIG